MKNKLQIFLIHGGETFKNQKDYLNYLRNRPVSIEKNPKWALEYLDKELGNKFDTIRPRMPLQENAKYEEWRLYFERFIPLLRNNVILIGNSLGGIFLAKYLSENKFPKKLLSVYLTCAPFDDTCPNDDLVGGFKLKSDLSLIEKNCKKVTFLFSADDDVVPVAHAEKYRNKLKEVKIIIYKSKNGHFKISKFPELVRMIKNDVKK
jgi:predicted alpha/beta hydrolase family esterase